MPYNIKKYSDLENLVKTSAETAATERDNLGRLQYDFIYSIPQRIAAAKEALRNDPAKQGALKLLEAAEANMNTRYEAYITNAADYVITRRAENMVLAGDGKISLSPEVKHELVEKVTQSTENHIDYGIGALAAYSIVSSVIDGRGYDMADITNMLVDNSVNQADSRLYPNSHPVMTVHRVQHERREMLKSLAQQLSSSDPTLTLDGANLADGSWLSVINKERQPLKLAPEKAVLHLDAMEMPTGSLSLDNYGRVMEQNPTEAARWAKQCFTSMIDGMYSEAELEDLKRNGIDPMQGVFIDSKPIKEFFAEERGGTERPLDDLDLMRAAKTIMDGGHTLTVCRMEKEHDGFYFGDPVPAEVRTEIKEEFSLWRAILRFFGLDKSTEQSRVAAMTAGDLEAEEAAIAINSTLFDPYLEDLVDETDMVIENIDKDFFLKNINVNMKENERNQYIQSFSSYDTDEVAEAGETRTSYTQTLGVRNMDRSQSRGTMAALYCLGSGMTLEQVLGSGSSEEKAALGREFIDLMTVQTRAEYAKAHDIEEKSFGFEERYKLYRADKEQQLMDMYTDKIAPVIHSLEREVRKMDVKDPASLSKHYPVVNLFVQAGIEFMQTSDNLYKAHPENPAFKKESEYALMLSSYTCIRDYIQERGKAFSNTGVCKADGLCIGLATKAAAINLIDTLDGRMLGDLTIDKAEIMNLARTNTSVKNSMRQRMLDIDYEQQNAMRGQLKAALNAKEAPAVFKDFVENIRTENFDKNGIAKLPVSEEEFVQQFTAAPAAKKAPAPALSLGVQK